jgi:50S ribosome-binding GTPase
MIRPELARLELMAEVDALSDSLERWAAGAPPWQPARTCSALVRRLSERLRWMRVRLETPLVVATLGGTGVGKSALVNALVGAELVETGRSRPTTHEPVLICRPDLTPKVLGIEPESVRLIQRDLPSLANLVVVDCPDPDTTEALEIAGTNLARLRQILPHCDVLLVATTQQKYRSARVAEELAAAAPGARLVFVQTHADADQDIREDWRRVLEPHYSPGHIFFVDSLAALNDVQCGLEPRGEFAGLMDLLTRQLAGAAAARIRRANLVDLVDDTLSACGQRIEEGTGKVAQLEGAIEQQRVQLGARLAAEMRAELLASRRTAWLARPRRAGDSARSCSCCARTRDWAAWHPGPCCFARARRPRSRFGG